jgi:hypothetical protein
MNPSNAVIAAKTIVAMLRSFAIKVEEQLWVGFLNTGHRRDKKEFEFSQISARQSALGLVAQILFIARGAFFVGEAA